MSITSAIVLYAVLWFMTFLIAIPIRLQTQGDVGTVVPGTHSSSPEVHNLRIKALITSGVAAVLWCILVWVIMTGQITVRDFDWMDRLPPVAEGES
jgi:predicted secreted protein